FPRVLLESWAMGTPVVASDVGAVRDIVPPESHNLIVAPGDVEGFANATVKVFALEKGHEDTRLRALAGAYDLPKVAAQFIRLFAIP
ncbi:MAG: glycosyltransferase, partial [Patescibacteria group bacterium]|nr:glycosyltransferase [Patescibacteria group bacterium]